MLRRIEEEKKNGREREADKGSYRLALRSVDLVVAEDVYLKRLEQTIRRKKERKHGKGKVLAVVVGGVEVERGAEKVSKNN